jgi:hypothetical protein
LPEDAAKALGKAICLIVKGDTHNDLGRMPVKIGRVRTRTHVPQSQHAVIVGKRQHPAAT